MQLATSRMLLASGESERILCEFCDGLGCEPERLCDIGRGSRHADVEFQSYCAAMNRECLRFGERHRRSGRVSSAPRLRPGSSRLQLWTWYRRGGRFEGVQVIGSNGAMAGSNTIATRATRGAISFRSSTHLPPSEFSILVKPLRLPPGRERRATNPLPTGSPTIAKTMGMVATKALAEFTIAHESGRSCRCPAVSRDQRAGSRP